MFFAIGSVTSAMVALAAITAPAGDVSAQQHVVGPFTLKIDGAGIAISFEGRVLIAKDETDGIPAPPDDVRWKIKKTANALTATFSYPRVTKRVILRRKDCFVEFGLTAPQEHGYSEEPTYALHIPGQVFAGGKGYSSGWANRGRTGWVDPDSHGEWRGAQVVGVIRSGKRFEFQHAVTMSWHCSRLFVPAERSELCRWQTNFSMGKGETKWSVYRFTTDPKTPLPVRPDDPLYPTVGNLHRDQGTLADDGYAISLRRNARAVFRGQSVRIDARYIDHDSKSRTITYSCRLLDWKGSVVSEDKGQFETGHQGSLVHTVAEIKLTHVGCFKFEFEASDGTAKIARQTAFVVLPRPHWYDSDTPHDGFHGGHIAGIADPWMLHIARMSGITWTRLHDSSGTDEVRWAYQGHSAEPERGQYALKEPVALKAFKKAGILVNASLGTGGPSWIVDHLVKNIRKAQPELSKEQAKNSLRSWYYYPEGLEAYKNFLRVMLKDRGHLIDAIEPQNEIYFDDNVPGQMNLVRAVREVVNEVAPHILIVCPNAPPGSYGSPWATLCKEAGVGQFADVVAGHFYVARGIAALGCETVMEQWCLSLRDIFTEHGRSKPVWNTEWCTNYPTPFLDHPHHWANQYAPGDPALWLTPRMYAVVNVRQFIAMVVHGVKSFWHVYYDGASLDRRLFEYDRTPNPAGVALSAATFILDGATFVDGWNPCPDIRGYVVDTPRGAAAVFFGRRFLDGEKASLEFTEGIPDAVVRDTMSNPIGPIKPGLIVTVENDPIYITAPSMTGPALLGHLNKALVTPPARESVVAKFLFDQTGEGKPTQVTDTTGTYLMRSTDRGADVAPMIVKDAVDQGPSAGTFTYPGNRALYFPKNSDAMMMMGDHDPFAHVFDATADPGMGVTAEAWVKLGSAPKIGNHWVAGVIFEKTRWRHAPQYRLWIDRNGRSRWTHSWGGGNHTYLRLDGPAVPLGKWTHLAGMTEYDGKTMRCRLFMDGQLVDDQSAERRPRQAAFTPVIIGGMLEPSPARILSDVTIDEITVHRRAIDPEELGWFKGSGNPELAKALAAGMKRAEAEDWAGFLPIDLSAVANRALRDETAGDKKGGWFDRGPNDMRNLPPGDWMMASVPMRIIDPGANNQKAVVVLKGDRSPDLPERVTVPINPLRIEKLHFLHAMGGGGRGVGALDATYIITQRDGKKSVINCREGIETASWWYMGSLENAKVAWTGSNPMTSKIRLYLYTWQNPDPANAVNAIELVSGTGPTRGTGPTPGIVAVTALCMP